RNQTENGRGRGGTNPLDRPADVGSRHYHHRDGIGRLGTTQTVVDEVPSGRHIEASERSGGVGHRCTFGHGNGIIVGFAPKIGHLETSDHRTAPTCLVPSAGGLTRHLGGIMFRILTHRDSGSHVRLDSLTLNPWKPTGTGLVRPTDCPVIVS